MLVVVLFGSNLLIVCGTRLSKTLCLVVEKSLITTVREVVFAKKSTAP